MGKHCMNPRTVIIILMGIVSMSSLGTEAERYPRDMAGFREYRVIGQKNIFRPRRDIDEGRGEPERGQHVGAEAALADIKVVGIIKMDGFLSSIAVIEEDGRQRLCRVGDIVAGMVIAAIGSHELIFETLEGKWVMEIEPGTVDYRATTSQAERAMAHAARGRSTSPGAAGRRLPINAAKLAPLIGTVGLVTAREGDTVKGVRLTQNFMGLREGDCVTYVGRQSLCTRYPRQKLWQIARKYSACSEEMPEIPIVIERNGIELEFVLCPVS